MKRKTTALLSCAFVLTLISGTVGVKKVFAEHVKEISGSKIQQQDSNDSDTENTASDSETENSEEITDPSSDVIVQSSNEDTLNVLTADADEVTQITGDTYVVSYATPEEASIAQEQVLVPSDAVDVVDNVLFNIESNEDIETELPDDDEESSSDKQSSNNGIVYEEGVFKVDGDEYGTLRELADALDKKLVAVIDTGSVNGQADVHVNFTDEEDAVDGSGHGSAVIDEIQQNDDDKAIIVSLKALTSNGKGYMSDIMKALQFCIDEKVDYVNMSLAAPASAKVQAFNDLVESAIDSGIKVVAAAGNYNSDVKKYVPAGLDGVLSVGAMNEDGSKIRTSNYNATYWEEADSTSLAAGIATGKLVAGKEKKMVTKLDDGSDTKASEKSEYESILAPTEQVTVTDENGNEEAQIMNYDVYVDPAVYSEMNETGGKGFITVPVDLSEFLPDSLIKFKDGSTGYYHFVYMDEDTGAEVFKLIKEHCGNMPVYVTNLEVLFEAQTSKYALTTKMTVHGASDNNIPWVYGGEHSLRFGLFVETDGYGNNTWTIRSTSYYPGQPNELYWPDYELLDGTSMKTTVQIKNDGTILYQNYPEYHTPILNNKSYLNDYSKWYIVCNGSFTRYGTFTVRYDLDSQNWLDKNHNGNWAAELWNANGQRRWYWVTSDNGSRYLSAEVTIDAGGPNQTFDLNGYLNGTSSGDLGDFGTADVYINGTCVANDVKDYYNNSIRYGSTYEIKDIKATSGHCYNGVVEGSLSGTLTGYRQTRLSFSSLHVFDLNGTIDGTTIYGIGGYGTADVYINGKLIAQGVDDYYNASVPYGSTYEVKNIKSKTGYTYTGGNYSGTITGNTSVYPPFVTNSYSFNLNILLPDGSEPYTTGTAGTVEMSVNGGAWTRVFNEPAGSYKYGTTFQFRNFQPGTGLELDRVSGIDSNWYAKMGTGGLNINFYTKQVYFDLTIDPNGGTYQGSSSPTTKNLYYTTKYELNDVPIREGYDFVGWVRTGSGSLHSGNAHWVSDGFTMAEKADSDGTAITNYKLNYVNSSSGYTYPAMAFYDYDYTLGHTYRLEFDYRVRSVSNLAYAHIRNAAFSNNWESPSGDVNGLTNGWVHRTVDRTFDSSTVSQAGVTNNVAPQIEFYCAVNPNTTGTLDMDLKNITVYDVTAGKYVTSKNGDSKVGSYVQMGSGNTTVKAIWTEHTYSNTIEHWIWGLQNNEGINGDKTAYRLGFTSFDAKYNSTFTVDAGKAMQIPNGYELVQEAGTSSISGGWEKLPFGTSVTQKAHSMYFEYDYRPIEYSITYNVDADVTNPSDNPTSYTILYGKTLKSPTRPGYNFDGWVDRNGNKVTALNEAIDMSFLASDGSTSSQTIYDTLAKRRTGDLVLTAKWTPTAPYMSTTQKYYYTDQTVTSDDLKQNANATDEIEGDISSRITIKTIEYSDGTVAENPTALDTSKEQTVKITYYVTNDRGGEVAKSDIVTIVRAKPDGTPEDHTNTDDPDGAGGDYYGTKIFARYIDKDTTYTLPGNSRWKTSSDYQSDLDSMNKSGDQYLQQYDNILNN